MRCAQTDLSKGVMQGVIFPMEPYVSIQLDRKSNRHDPVQIGTYAGIPMLKFLIYNHTDKCSVGCAQTDLSKGVIQGGLFPMEPYVSIQLDRKSNRHDPVQIGTYAGIPMLKFLIYNHTDKSSVGCAQTDLSKGVIFPMEPYICIQLDRKSNRHDPVQIGTYAGIPMLKFLIYNHTDKCSVGCAQTKLSKG